MSIDVMIKVFESSKKKIEKHILSTYANNKTKVETKKTHSYIAILLSLMKKFKDVLMICQMACDCLER